MDSIRREKTGARPLRILVVDDSPIFRDVIGRFLKALGGSRFPVVGVGDTADQALEKAAELKPDVILLDLNMPGTPSLQVIPILRQKFPETAVIILTLHDAKEYRQAAQTAGAGDFVSKAALGTDLLPAIRRAAPFSGPRQPAGQLL